MNNIYYTICPILGYNEDGEEIINYEEWADDQTFKNKEEAYDYMYSNNLQESWIVVDWVGGILIKDL